MPEPGIGEREHVRFTERLLLRPPTLADADAVFAIYGDPRTNQHNPLGPHADRAASEAVLDGWISHWRQHGFGQWMISRRDAAEQVIGCGGVWWRGYGDRLRLNLGYRFAVSAWGCGFATELGREALRHAHDDLAKPDVYGLVRPAHAASIRVLEKLQMTRIGTLDDVAGAAPSLVFRHLRWRLPVTPQR